jgi:UDP-N-acetylmuramoyl-tripeptide--D-alanyl-D-alanine ligase
MIKAVLSRYSAHYISTLVYMLQNTEYQVRPYLSWVRRTKNFSSVIKRRTLDKTKAARVLTSVLRVGIATHVCIGLGFVSYGTYGANLWYFVGGLVLIIMYPFIWAYVICIPVFLGRLLIIKPRQKLLIKAAQDIFLQHKAIKIAVAGSYGKTSMKEMLLTVLSQGKRTAATPGNQNVAISHAEFAHSLQGNEEVLILEFGEGKPGDIKEFAELTHPTIGVITGIAPAHLDNYKTIEIATKDIFYLAKYLKGKSIYVNAESEIAPPYITEDLIPYSINGCNGWKVQDINITSLGTSFKLKKTNSKIALYSQLLGRHQVGPLTAVIEIAHSLGLSDNEIIEGVAHTKPFEHRMQPRQLHGAWIIDDTYNGNIEGVRVGLQLLKELPAKRRIYVTPGLVEQGARVIDVHKQLGKFIADCAPDVVVLMQNSTTEFIKAGIGKNFTGEIIIEDNPYEFYQNLSIFVAAGDVVLMQNDWTDNYA